MNSMHGSAAQLILRARKVAYAITDSQLIIREAQGDWEQIDETFRNAVGFPLLDLVPELVGSEEILNEILAGKTAELKLNLVNRETQDGGIRYLLIHDLPYHDEAGEIAGIVHLVQDLTERGLLEQELTQKRNDLSLLQDRITRQNLDLKAANIELQRLSDLKSQFVSLAAHELRTPLTSINGYVEMLLDGEAGVLADGQREYLEIVQQSRYRLMKVTTSLIDAVRLDAGHMDLELQPANLANLVEIAAAEQGFQLREKNQILDLDFAPGLAPALCDKTRAVQIISNLLSNAIKYTPKGGRISIQVGPAEDAGFLLLTVADTGIGISANDLANIFNPWFRTSHALSLDSHGIGLGLYIARSLVELHGGSIQIESSPGQGSRFHVTFLKAA